MKIVWTPETLIELTKLKTYKLSLRIKFIPIINCAVICCYQYVHVTITFMVQNRDEIIKHLRLAEPNSFFGNDMISWLVDNGWSNSPQSALFLCSDILFANKIIVPGWW